jgi:hypothetical protein
MKGPRCRPHRVFTAQNLVLIERMASQGHSAREIALAIGSTPSSVRVKCSHRKIRLKRGRGRARHPVSLGQIDQTPQDRGKMPVLAHMPAELYVDFSRKAVDLAKSPSIFASMLLTAIATSDLYKAVLDD